MINFRLEAVTMKQALLYASARVIKEELIIPSDTVVVVFSDGSALFATSLYESDYSDDTPGQGIEPPSFQLCRDYEVQKQKMELQGKQDAEVKGLLGG